MVPLWGHRVYITLPIPMSLDQIILPHTTGSTIHYHSTFIEGTILLHSNEGTVYIPILVPLQGLYCYPTPVPFQGTNSNPTTVPLYWNTILL